jgi:hypothetical protein
LEVANVSIQDFDQILASDKSYHDRIDELELKMSEYPPADCPLQHVFTPGLYSRTILMKAGDLIVSKIHRSRHQFFVLAGIAWIQVNGKKWERVEAPYLGITEPGTRRILYIEENCLFATCHPTNIMPVDDSPEALKDAVDMIEDEIIEKRPKLKSVKNEN